MTRDGVFFWQPYRKILQHRTNYARLFLHRFSHKGLDSAIEMWYIHVPMKLFSTAEVAKKLGLHRPHLQRAIAEGRVKAPKVTLVGGVKFRLWTIKDVEKARKALKKAKK